MQTKIEKELKRMVAGRDGFDSILARLKTVKSAFQLNVYLGRAPDLEVSGLTARIRFSANYDPLMTIKKGRGIVDGAFVADETEGRIRPDAAVSFVKGGGDIVFPCDGWPAQVGVILGNMPYKVTYWSLTRRTVCDIGLTAPLEADETVYADGAIDYELELENADSLDGLRFFNEIESSTGVATVASPVTKQARARAGADRCDNGSLVPNIIDAYGHLDEISAMNLFISARDGQ